MQTPRVLDTIPTPTSTAPTPTAAMMMNSDPESSANRQAAAAAKPTGTESPAKRPRLVLSPPGQRLTKDSPSGLTPLVSTTSLDTANSFGLLEQEGTTPSGGAEAQIPSPAVGSGLELVLDTDAMPPPGRRSPPGMPPGRTASAGGGGGGGGSYGRSASTDNRKRPGAIELPTPELELQPATPDMMGAGAGPTIPGAGDGFDGPFAMPPVRRPSLPSQENLSQPAAALQAAATLFCCWNSDWLVLSSLTMWESAGACAEDAASAGHPADERLAEAAAAVRRAGGSRGCDEAPRRGAARHAAALVRKRRPLLRHLC
jgi:hypothetical protein